MALVERMRAALNALLAPAPAQKAASSSEQAFGQIVTHALDMLTAGNAAALTRPFEQHPTVHAAVSAISSAISALPLEMFPESDEEREEPVKDSIVLDLIENPGPDMDGPQLIEATVDFMKLDGDAFWFLDGFARRTAGGPQFPKRIELWEPQSVAAVTDGGQLVAWEYRDSTGGAFRAPADRVIQFKHFNPYNRHRGLAPLLAAKIAASGGYKALAYQEAFLDNDAVPRGILTPVEGSIIQREALMRLRDEMEARHRGVTRTGRIGALNTPVQFLELGMSQKDMDFPLWLDAASAFILMVFKVPPSVAGLQKDANYNESVHQSKRFWYNHMPLVQYIQRRIKSRLCRQYGIAEEPWFKTESIKAMIEDQTAVTEQARNLWNMGVPFEQINERLELGFDTDYPAAEVPWIPFSMVNANEQAMAPPAAATGGPARDPLPGDTPNQPGDESTVADDPTMGKGLRLVKGAGRHELYRKMNWQTLIARIRDEEGIFEKRVRDHFYQLRGEVLRKLRQTPTAKAAEPAQFDVEAVMFDKDKAAADIKGKTGPLYESALEKGAKAVLAELQIEVDFNMLTPQVQQFLARKRIEIADLVDGPAADALRAELQAGLSEGDSVEAIADRVERVFSAERGRARRIARTETAQAFNGGRFEVMKDAGVERIEWLSARDARVRDSHVDLDGDQIVVGDKFRNGLYYPLDPAGPPEEIVNCRCIAVPVA